MPFLLAAEKFHKQGEVKFECLGETCLRVHIRKEESLEQRC